jgi:hypothetical protein
MYQASAPVFRQGLTTLSALLDKAVAQCGERKIDPAVLLADRLAPDMFPLTRQIQLAADFAKNGISRLAGRQPPKHEDVETTVAELQDRIAKALAVVAETPAAEVDGSEGREITLPMRDGTMTMSGEAYLLHFVLPNFFFHLATAYAILRHNGLAVGKRDFIGSIPGVVMR